MVTNHKIRKKGESHRQLLVCRTHQRQKVLRELAVELDIEPPA